MKKMEVFPIVTSAIKNAGYIDNKSLTFLVENKYPTTEPHREVKLLQHYNKTLYYIKWVSNIVKHTKYCVY